MNMFSLICPVSALTIDKNAARIGAILTAALLAAFALTGQVVFLGIVVADYLIRVFSKNLQPPVAYLARRLAQALRLGATPANRGPKIFAWRVGLLFALSALVLFFVNPFVSSVLAVVLLGFNLLDGVFNFCVGCLVYTYITLPLKNACLRSQPEK